MLLDICHHLLLKRQIFKYRLNNKVTVGKTAVIRRPRNQRQRFVSLTCLYMAAFDL
jgi:hypothetical protein